MRTAVGLALGIPLSVALFADVAVSPVVIGFLTAAVLIFGGRFLCRRASWSPAAAVTALVFHESVARPITPAAFAIGSVLILGVSRAAAGSATLFDQLQSQLTWGMHVAILVAIAVVAFTGCGSVAGEFETRTAAMLFAKPLRRPSFLIGKCVGAFGIGFALLTALTVQVALDVDRLAASASSPAGRSRIENELTVGRTAFAANPVSGTAFDVEVDRAARKAAQEDPEKLQALGPEAFIAQVREDLLRIYRTSVPPDRVRTFVFEGLPSGAEDLQLAFEPRMYPPPVNDRILLEIAFGDAEPELRSFIEGKSIVVPVPEVATDGRLVVRLANPEMNLPIGFRGNTGPELLAPTRGFAANVVVAILLSSIKLLLCAIASVVVSAFTGLPVALFSMITLIVVVTVGPFLSEFVVGKSNLGPPPDQFVEVVIDKLNSVGESFIAFFGKIGELSPVEAIGEGRTIGIASLLRALAAFGLGLSGFVALVGLGLFRRREIERVQLR